jgi:hypothetical protein
MMGFEASSPIVVCRVGHLHDMKDLHAQQTCHIVCI